ncbi:MAG: SIS domain-containing protein, partial [Pseudomonadota bacterium]
AKARNVVLIGALSSAPLIDYLSYMARMAFPHWRAAFRDNETVGMALNGLGKRDAILVLSQAPYAHRAVEAVQRAHAAGVPVVAITDSYAAPIAANAARVFVAPTDSPHFFASAVPSLVLIETLLSMVVRRSGAKAQERIAAVERENHRSGEYQRD